MLLPAAATVAAATVAAATVAAATEAAATIAAAVQLLLCCNFRLICLYVCIHYIKDKSVKSQLFLHILVVGRPNGSLSIEKIITKFFHREFITKDTNSSFSGKFCIDLMGIA